MKLKNLNFIKWMLRLLTFSFKCGQKIWINNNWGLSFSENLCNLSPSTDVSLLIAYQSFQCIKIKLCNHFCEFIREFLASRYFIISWYVLKNLLVYVENTFEIHIRVVRKIILLSKKSCKYYRYWNYTTDNTEKITMRVFNFEVEPII